MSDMQPNDQIPNVAPQGSQQPYAPQNVGQPVQPYQQPYAGSPSNVQPPAKKRSFNLLFIPIIVLGLLLMGSLGFGFWANSERNDFKNNADQKIEAAVGIAVTEAEKRKEAEFLEREKEPLSIYTTPGQFGSISLQYPKTWSAYVDESGRGGAPIAGHFHPDFVPGLNSSISFALKLEVLERDYDVVLQGFNNDARSGKVKISPLGAKNVPGTAGVRIDGEVESKKPGSVVLFPLRDKTLMLTTLSDQFMKDFESIILENLKFTP